MNKFRYRKNINQSFTTDDCSKLDSYKSNDEVLKLIKYMNEISELLNEINIYICQQNFNFVKEHKPIFDKQKLIIIKINLIIDDLTSSGLKKSFKDNQIKYDYDFLDSSTFNNEWNNKAKSINNLLFNTINKNNEEYISINILYNDNDLIKKDKKQNNFNILSFKFLFITILLIIIIIYYNSFINYSPFINLINNQIQNIF